MERAGLRITEYGLREKTQEPSRESRNGEINKIEPVQGPRSRDGGKGRIKDYGVWIKEEGKRTQKPSREPKKGKLNG